MHLPLVSNICPATQADTASFYPSILLDGSIAMSSDERKSDRVFFVDGVGVFDLKAGKLKRTFRMPSESPKRPWEVHITNERIIVRKSPLPSASPTTSEARGHYVGHVPYAYAHILSAIYHKGKIVLAICVTHADNTISALTLSSDNEITMRRILADLHQSIDAWLDANNRRLTPWGLTDQKYEAQCEEWRNFLSTAWTDGGKVVLVPRDMATLMPN